MQEVTVFAIVGAAVIYLLKQILGTAKGESNCGTCSASAGCAVAAIAAARKKKSPWEKLVKRVLPPRFKKRPPSDIGSGFQV